jgi:hypothetical protein
MRLIPVIAAVLSLFISCPSFAQGWIEYSNQEDFFTVNFPGEPDVADITFDTEYFITLPGRSYSYEDGGSRYSVTVVDYTVADQLHRDLVDTCNDRGGDGDSCVNRWATDMQGAIIYASWNYLKRDDAKLTHLVYTQADRVSGHALQFDNADGSRTYVAIHMHADRLYILDGTVPPNSVPPALFQQSMGFLDPEGNSIRYDSAYTNGYPAPTRAR